MFGTSKLILTSKFCRCKYLISFAHKSTTTNYYDVIIAGGGIIGNTLACTLGKNSILANQKILVLEANKNPTSYTSQQDYRNRVIFLNKNTQSLLESIDAWQHVTNERLGIVKRMHVWEALSDAMITFNQDQADIEDLGYVVENDLIVASVDKELKDVGNVEIKHGAKVKEYKLGSEKNEVILESGEEFSCELLIGCDGANSKVRQAMNAHYLSWNYDQVGIVATMKLSEPEENVIAWQRFLPTGPIATLPLNNEYSSLVWTTTPEHAEQLLSLSDEQFVDEINSAMCKEHSHSTVVDKAVQTLNGLLRSRNAVKQLPPRIAEVTEGSRAKFPLGFGHSSSYIFKGVVLVGDAAHRVPPLAGQGANLGFGDVVCLNDLLGEAIYAGSSLSSIQYLKEYESERQKHNLPKMLAFDGLQKLYNTSFMPVVLMRSVGLQIVNAITPLKRAIVTQAEQ